MSRLETPDLFSDHWQATDAAAEARASRGRFKDHMESLRTCWPDWRGPRIRDDVHGRCSIGRCGRWYCAPCVIRGIGPRVAWLDVEINYPAAAPAHCRKENGTIVRIEFTDLWVPVDELWEIRREEEAKETMNLKTL